MGVDAFAEVLANIERFVQERAAGQRAVPYWRPGS